MSDRKSKFQLSSMYGKMAQQFPGTQAELDILTVVARLQQLKNQTSKPNQEWIIYQLTTNDLPRLETYLSQKVKDWSGLFGTK